MRRRSPFPSLTLLAFPLLGLAAPRTSAALDPRAFVPIEDVRPGARCVGKTVFSGTEISEFEMEVLGVVRGATPGGSLIIARAEGDLLERTGILQGMSGSPVYLDGRLVGAVSSTWAFTKEPIAGITPIDEMLPALTAGIAPSGKGGGALGIGLLSETAPAVSRLSWVWRESGARPAHDSGSGRSPLGAFDGRQMMPIALPLLVPAGEAYARRLDGVLGALGFAPVVGARLAGAAAPARADLGGTANIEPGSAVGVALVTGDADWSAVGTVTYRDGDRVLAFGHPMFSAGTVELPMVGAYVHALLPLQSVSFKYASGTEPIGTFVQDREKMVAGRLGAPPSMIPLEVNIADADSDTRRYSLGVVRSRPYASLFAGLAAGACVAEAAKTTGPACVALRATLATDAETVEYDNAFVTDEPAVRVAGELAGLMDLVLENGFAERSILGATLAVDIREEERWASIERVDTDRTVYRPGDNVVLTVTLRAWQGETIVRTMVLSLPPSQLADAVTVRVGCASAFREWEQERLGGGLRPRSMRQLLDLIERSKSDDTVVAQLLVEAPGVSLSGRELRGVPSRAALTIGRGAGAGAADLSGFTLLDQAEFALGIEAAGSQTFTLRIGERR